VNARVIAATGVDLDAAVADGSFRLDLYHRLLVLAFHMPPLRDRGADILLLARHFVCTFAARHGRRVGDLAADAIRLVERHPWPGNIRQLAHAMEAAVLLAPGPSIRAADIPHRVLRETGAEAALSARYSFYGTRQEERARIIDALRSQRGNLTRTARALGMARNTLRARMLTLQITCAKHGSATD
jgi:DNA-binding NtrC family response regulator